MLKSFFYLGIALIFFIKVPAQVPQGVNLSTVNIATLSDEQFMSYVTRAQLTGLSEEELESKAKANGLTDYQIGEIKLRLAKIEGGKKPVNITYDTRKSVETVKPVSKTKDALPVFGEDFFTNNNLTFEPNLRIATPGNYVLGVDDELTIDIFGYSEKITKVKINTEGQIRLPNIGPVTLAGLSIDEAKIKLKQVMKKVYPGLATGKTSIQLGLGQIRTIRVILIGEIKNPGTYSLPSLSTIANALYLSGGPSANGSYRKISLIRNGKRIVQFDLYDFLLNGDLSKNGLLKDEDIIKVEPFSIRVSIAGAVKKPGVYECLTSDCLKDVINIYAGGLTDNANKQKISIQRIGDSSKLLLDVPYKSLEKESVKSSDYITVGSIIEKFDNKVSINGAVFFPGDYSLDSSKEILSLLRKAKIKDNAFTNRALLYRLNNFEERVVEAVNLQDIFAGKKTVNLRNGDFLQVFYKSALEEAANVKLTGEVNSPGSFAFTPGMLLEDIILLGGGLTDKASLEEIEVLRRLRKDKTLADTVVYNSIYKFSLKDSLALKPTSLAIPLEPFDVVNVKNLPRNKTAGSVIIRGEVLFPGVYQLNSKNDRVTDLLQRAGGLVGTANVAGATLLRNTFPTNMGAEIRGIKKQLIYNQLNDSLAEQKLIQKIDVGKQVVSFDLANIISNPKNSANLFLEDGDIIEIPKTFTTVSVFGAVRFEKKMTFSENLSFKKAIREAGGFTEIALKKGAYVVYPNGKVKTVRRALFLRVYPSLIAGSEIYVPEQKVKKRLSTTETLGISSSIIGMSTLVFAILNAIK
ncbi:MAG: SLBB domain-containing protein [Sediminibacterium sp.]|jgi:protein involved in polysaccharide export with SLBB domain|nr:SLBB domain-containing protein [Chitinophagaceae bacterium]MCA6447485.1 SLBB domain-containing protein [Chitinophagaceae bacterium]